MDNRTYFPMYEKSKYVYVNNNLLTTFASGPTRVHINPNFKPNIHVNPNFTALKSNIHVNPNVLQSTARQKSVPVSLPETRKVVSTRTKLVRVPVSADVRTPQQVKHKSRYKLVKVPRENKSDDSSVRSKYKIDKRKNSSLKKIYKKMILNKSFNAQRVLINNKVKTSRGNVVSINGVVYKRSPNSLRRSNSFETPKSKVKNYKLVNNKTVKNTVAKHRSLGGKNPFSKVNVKRKSSDGPEKRRKSINSTQGVKIKRIMASYRKILNAQVTPSKMKKCNIPCRFYRKFGKCKGKDNGTCNRVHNPDQITVCSKFLQGCCINENCLLSHKVSLEKMPTCRFFLEGMCTKEDCPYLHVKINPKADICVDFLRGFCEKAIQCDKRHQYLCPEFEKTGSCPKKRCSYPHRNNAVRKSGSRLKLPINRQDHPRVTKQNQKVGQSENVDKAARYYEDVTESGDAKGSVAETVKSDFKMRPKIGCLPSFIPFDQLEADKS